MKEVMIARNVSWAIFWVLSVIAWIVPTALRRFEVYYDLLPILDYVRPALAIVCLGLGGFIVLKSESRLGPGILVMLGLVIGQKWLLFKMFAFFTWKIGGFAP
jgi:hypothetical protein